MDNVVSLNKARVERTGCPRDWSVMDALEQVIDKIRRGELSPDKIYIAMSTETDEGVRLSHAWAGAGPLECAGLLSLHLMLAAKGEE